MYFTKTPYWLTKLYNQCTWQMPATGKTLYLTFDDGPIPGVTEFVLDQLKDSGASATFFCIGKNVRDNPEIYKRIIIEGHAVGNHTFNHLNGWKAKSDVYMNDIKEAKKFIDSNLFRPPYGRINMFQLNLLDKPAYQLKPVMWTVLSGDFDEKITQEKCLDNVLKNSKEGSIIVFHDSLKAADKMTFALPGVLKYFGEKGYSFDKIRL